MAALEVGDRVQLITERLGDRDQRAQPLQGHVLVDREPILQVLEELAGGVTDGVQLRQPPQLVGLFGQRPGALLPQVGGPPHRGAGLIVAVV